MAGAAEAGRGARRASGACSTDEITSVRPATGASVSDEVSDAAARSLARSFPAGGADERPHAAASTITPNAAPSLPSPAIVRCVAKCISVQGGDPFAGSHTSTPKDEVGARPARFVVVPNAGRGRNLRPLPCSPSVMRCLRADQPLVRRRLTSGTSATSPVPRRVNVSGSGVVTTTASDVTGPCGGGSW
jgi:hypothetical protein